MAEQQRIGRWEGCKLGFERCVNSNLRDLCMRVTSYYALQGGYYDAGGKLIKYRDSVKDLIKLRLYQGNVSFGQWLLGMKYELYVRTNSLTELYPHVHMLGCDRFW